jgi:multicomponent Na+:H+ antiporter subunit B
MRLFAWLVLIAFGLLMVSFILDLPPRGDPESPASTHVSPTYLRDAEHDMATPNVVTAVLADYRGYDTLGETTVIFAAGLACLLVLFRRENAPEDG